MPDEKTSHSKIRTFLCQLCQVASCKHCALRRELLCSLSTGHHRGRYATRESLHINQHRPEQTSIPSFVQTRSKVIIGSLTPYPSA